MTAGLEAENGALGGSATLSPDTSASGGNAVMFKAGAVTPPVTADAIYVATTGNDSNAGTQASPYKTLAKALTAVQAGRTVYVRAGTYATVNQVINAMGTASNRITISAYPGEKVILDASGGNLSLTGSIVDIKGSYITFSGFELRNSSGRAMTMTGTGNVVSNNIMHDVKTNGLVDAGTNNTVDSNEFYNTVLQNENNAMGSGGWAEALNTFQSTNSTFKNNYIHDNWGEGIDFIRSTGGVADNNTVTDSFSVLIYVDGTSSVKVTNNHLANTKPTYDRSTGAAYAILLADESGGSSLSNLTITGNTMYGTRGISTWNVTLNNSTQANNTTCTTLACAIPSN